MIRIDNDARCGAGRIRSRPVKSDSVETAAERTIEDPAEERGDSRRSQGQNVRCPALVRHAQQPSARTSKLIVLSAHRYRSLNRAAGDQHRSRLIRPERTQLETSAGAAALRYG